MTDLLLLPDIEKLVSEYLRSRDEVTDIYDDRVYTELPAEKAWPLLRVVRIGGAPDSSVPRYLDRPLVQFDSWGGSKSLARRGAETVRAVLDDLPGVHDEGVVAWVTHGRLLYLPDQSLNPVRPRFTFDAVIGARPSTVA